MKTLTISDNNTGIITPDNYKEHDITFTIGEDLKQCDFCGENFTNLVIKDKSAEGTTTKVICQDCFEDILKAKLEVAKEYMQSITALCATAKDLIKDTDKEGLIDHYARKLDNAIDCL